MNPIFEFSIEIKPQPKERPRIGRWGRAYTPTKTHRYEEQVLRLVQRQLKISPPLISQKLRAEITFCESPPKSWSKKRRQQAIGEYVATSPDLDNLEKAFYDALNGWLYKDDSKIVEHTTRKVYADFPIIHARFFVADRWT